MCAGVRQPYEEEEQPENFLVPHQQQLKRKKEKREQVNEMNGKKMGKYSFSRMGG